MTDLQDKTLIMLVAPSAMGKSAIMNEIVRVDDRFGRVSGFTTRSPRPNDEPHMYRYIDKPAAKRLIEGGVVQHAIHPSTEVIYGSELSDYGSEYNVLDTLSGAVDSLRKIDFRETAVVSVVAPAGKWIKWFVERYPEPSEEASKRLEEARTSLLWSLSETCQHWLVNDGSITDSARKLINITTKAHAGDNGEEAAREILMRIEKGVWS